MSSSVLFEYAKIDHEDRVRKAERDRLYITARRANRRPSILKSLLLALTRS
jgi:hypothetical protein